MPRRPTPLDRLYRWESGSRRWSRWRMLLVLAVIEAPAILALLVLRYGGTAVGLLRGVLEGVVLVSTAAMLGWAGYSLLRTATAAWNAVRGRPHELQSWREP